MGRGESAAGQDGDEPDGHALLARPPNTRVQRTRAARFARTRLPLTRHPLGGLRK